jgi:hypothetical protein
MAAAFLLVFFGGESVHVWAVVAAAAVVLLELMHWALARVALRRVPDSFSGQVFASLPLDYRGRWLVSLALVTGLGTPIFLLAVMPESSFFNDHRASAAVLLIAAAAPSLLSLYRVWRHNTWLAVSRIPARPRRSHPRYRGPHAM